MGINETVKSVTKISPPDFSDIEFCLDLDIDGTAVEYAYRFDFNYTEGRPAKLFGLPENCHPEESAEIDIVGCQQEGINGRWYDADYSHFKDGLIKEALKCVAKMNEAKRESGYEQQAEQRGNHEH